MVKFLATIATSTLMSNLLTLKMGRFITIRIKSLIGDSAVNSPKIENTAELRK